jgi:hypothetical protein
MAKAPNQTRSIPRAILALCAKVTAKRPKTVIDHIIKHGFISTEDLKNSYGYDHPPRAIRDVRESGIPLVTYKVRSNTTGRSIAAYKFDDPGQIKSGRIGGRKAFSKEFKEHLAAKYGNRSAITGERMELRYLQIDHRVPYEIAGETDDPTDLACYMLLDASAQRAKSWSCENCENFRTLRDPENCWSCFWASPEDYDHIALDPSRRLYLEWSGPSVKEYEKLKEQALQNGLSVQDLVKKLITTTDRR